MEYINNRSSIIETIFLLINNDAFLFFFILLLSTSIHLIDDYMARCEWNLPLDIYSIPDLMGIHGQDDVVLVFHYSPSNLIAILLQFHSGTIKTITTINL